MNLSPGKRRHLHKLSSDRGVIAAVAMDQRVSLQKLIAKLRGVTTDAVSIAQMAEFKATITRGLTPHATAILLDPEFGLDAAGQRAPNAGLLLAYEESGYDNSRPGRLPDLLPHVSVHRMAGWGADAVKLLVYYSPLEDPRINDIKHALVERTGAECAAEDIPFFLELIGYDAAGSDEKSLEYAKKKPEIIRGGMVEFSKPFYRADVLKVGVPVNTAFVEGSRAFKGVAAYSKSEALHHFRDCAEASRLPFIYLSAGVGNAEFVESLEMAAEAGADFSGVLCGRATWKDGVPVYAISGVAALEDWLATEGARNINAVNQALARSTPWYVKMGVQPDSAA